MPRSPTPPPSFPLYLLPSIPFPFRRRRRSSTSSTSPSTSPPTQPSSFLSRGLPTSHLRCHKCLSDLVPTSSIISKGFTGRHGRAYLVAGASPPSVTSPGAENMHSDLPNTRTHKPVPRRLVTGAHTVSDISCARCGHVLGWKYVGAEEESQRYKVGKFILETERVVRGAGFEDAQYEDEAERDAGLMGSRSTTVRGEDVEFDSQDEEECEDLFSGIWSPQLARRRRKHRGIEADD